MKYIIVVEYKYTSPLVFSYDDYNYALSMYEANLSNYRITLFELENGNFKELLTKEVD